MRNLLFSSLIPYDESAKHLAIEEEQRIGALSEDNLERNKLVEQNLNLAFKLVSNYIQDKPSFAVTDLFSAALKGLTEASRKFKNGYGKFATFAWKKIKWEIMQENKFHYSVTKLPQNKEKMREDWDYIESLDEWVNSEAYLKAGEQNFETSLSRLEANIDFEKIKPLIEKLDDDEKFVIENFYGISDEELSATHIAEKLNICRQSVYNIKDSAISKLRKELKIC